MKIQVDAVMLLILFSFVSFVTCAQFNAKAVTFGSIVYFVFFNFHNLFVMSIVQYSHDGVIIMCLSVYKVAWRGPV